MAVKKTTPKLKGVASKKATSMVTTASKKKVTARTRIPPSGGVFASKLAAWEAILDEAVAATTAVAARRAYEKAEALDHLPVDLYAEDDVDEAALGRAHTAMNQKLNARMKALPVTSEVVHELSCLRSLINTT